MVRIILGVVVGFIVWSVLWLGSDQVLINLSRSWYGQHQYAFEDAMLNQTAFTPDHTILIMHLVRSVIISLMSGFIAAMVACSRLSSVVLARSNSRRNWLFREAKRRRRSSAVVALA